MASGMSEYAGSAPFSTSTAGVGVLNLLATAGPQAIKPTEIAAVIAVLIRVWLFPICRALTVVPPRDQVSRAFTTVDCPNGSIVIQLSGNKVRRRL